MKAAVSLATKVSESICQLPGVAILDWCDRAAGALTRLHPNSVITVAVGLADERCVMQLVESAGAAWSGSPIESMQAGHAGVPMRSLEHRSMGPGLDQAPVDLQHVRESFRDGQWLGWDFKPLGPGQVHVESARLTPAATRRTAAPLNIRYDTVNPAEILCGAVGLGPAGSSLAALGNRVLVTEVAMQAATPADIQRLGCVLAAVLPMVASRYLKAVGEEPATKQSWLTPREELILWKLVAGKKVPVIATELHRSIYTVHDHVKSLHKKLHATNRGQLVSRALGHLGPLVSREAETTVE